jgi:PadR family transcriptional regulator, regulatory protein PadR
MRKELVAAFAEPLILSLLSKGESYGYAISQEIKTRSREESHWTDGMLYPVLHRMENNGWITSRWVTTENGRARKYYSLNQQGEKVSQTQCKELPAAQRVLTSYGAATHV